MMSGLVNASISLPEWQAVKMIFFAPWKIPRPYSLTALKTYLKTSKKFERRHKQRDSRLQVTDRVNLKTTVLWESMAIF